MKIKTSTKTRGIVLAVTLGMILILAIIVTAYIKLVNNRNTAVARSQSWNQAIPVLESGIEEGLTQLYLSGTNGLQLTSNSWTYSADHLYHKSRTFSDGSYYNVSIQVTNNPIIVSTGFVRVPGMSTLVSRRVKVATKAPGVHPGGIRAKGAISMGPGSMVDSFDSSNPLYSSNGLYTASLAESNAMVLTDGNGNGIISTSGTIKGSADTGPTGTVAGTVTGSINNDAHVQFNDPAAPYVYGTATTPSSGTYQGSGVSYLLIGGNYNLAGLSLSGNNEMAVTGGSNVLYINGGMSTGGNGEIYIAPDSTLLVYVTGAVDIGGNGIVNAGQLSTQCVLNGSPTCTAITIHGNGNYIGTVNAPEAALSFSGNGAVFGAVTASSVSLGDHTAFHYDELLGYTGGGYVVTSWNEF